ncbi:MAG: hypothetical protein DYH03_14015 [Nitrospira sp. NTP1]|nr:hypothetical protein [Nitrospira sp. NTP1]
MAHASLKSFLVVRPSVEALEIRLTIDGIVRFSTCPRSFCYTCLSSSIAMGGVTVKSADHYIKASRYDLEAQQHNRGVFHRRMLRRPWLALLFGLGMSALGAGAAFNWADGPRWQFHPWEGWLLGGIAGLVAGYFFVTAMQGWRRHHSVTQH